MSTTATIPATTAPTTRSATVTAAVTKPALKPTTTAITRPAGTRPATAVTAAAAAAGARPAATTAAAAAVAAAATAAKATTKAANACSKRERLAPNTRIAGVVDTSSFEEWDRELLCHAPVSFPAYEDRLVREQDKTSCTEAVCCGRATIEGQPVALVSMNPFFLMGSMGSTVGEKITRAIERAGNLGLPLIVFASSGGARMQEGLASLLQMAKISCALAHYAERGLLYISVMTDPTTGGVMAALSSQGDIIIVEKGAEVGFTGRRVIEATFRPQLPDNFQSAEYSLSHGLIDMAVERPELRATLARVLALHRHPTREASGHTHKVEVLPGVGRSRGASGAPAHGNTRTAWETVSLARGMNRPTAQSYLTEIVTDFVELHGDRCFSDDRAIIGGIGFIGGQPVTIIAQEKGTTTSERVSRNFGMPLPEGYRKAIRLARQAEKFGRPVICLVDTQGAHCGVESEDRGQGNAVGDCLTAMSTLRVPVISVILSEGGSGGALAFALANSVGMLENAIYSICSPEAFATILWKAPSRAAEAAEVMRLTAHDALDLAAIDEVIPEPAEGAHTDPHATAEAVGHFILRELEHLMPLDAETLMRKRQQRFRDFLRVEGEHAHEANILNFRTADSEKPELPVAQSS